nr:MAG TPA: hypothetical protein [Caudoviricetes sp.]
MYNVPSDRAANARVACSQKADSSESVFSHTPCSVSIDFSFFPS